MISLTESYVPADTSEPILDTTVGSALRDVAHRLPDKLALVAGSPDPSKRRTWTYAELLAEAEQAARALTTRFNKGDRMAIYSANCPEWVILEFAAGLAGVVLVTVNPALQPQELHYVLDQSRSSGVIYQPSFRGNPMEAHLESVLPDLPEMKHVISLAHWDDFIASGKADRPLPIVDPMDPVQIQYTSGTTGFPKGASLHHRGISNNGRLFAERLLIDERSVYVNPMPLFHTGGCVLAVLGGLQRGATLVLMEMFDPGLMLELIETYEGTHLVGVPTMLIAAMEHPDFETRDLSSLVCACAGGATVPADLVRQIEAKLGVFFSVIYGQTEASPTITLAKSDDSPEDKALTLGPALPQTEIKVIDTDTGETLPIGQSGELCTRGYLVMLGYFDMPDKTAETIDADGWLHTGDLVAMDDRGYTRITGRLKDMIIRGGENIYPREIEELLFGHPEVAEVAVVGLPHERWGETVGAFIRDSDPTRPATDAELHQYCRDNLAPHKTPTSWFRVEAFPLTGSGKVQKFAIRKDWEKGLYS